MNNVSTIALSSNKSSNLLVSASLTLVKSQLYQCWLQVYGPLFWIVSAVLCLCSTSPPRPVIRRNSVYQPRTIEEEPVAPVIRPDQPVVPKMETDMATPQPKRSLRRSIRHHMQSFKHSLNEAVKRSLFRRQHKQDELVHPLDKDTQTRLRRKSFGGYSQHPIFNPFRRKTAPELVHYKQKREYSSFST